MSARDPYEVLGVARDASADEIRRAYRRMAVENHPDKKPGDAAAEERFKEAAAAYAVLSDPKKREAFDRGGDERTAGGAGFAEDMSVEDILRRYADLFGGAFGREFHSRRDDRQRGEDVEASLDVDLRTAALGGKVSLRLGGFVACSACSGRGTRDAARTCQACGGSGRTTRQSSEPGQLFTYTTICSACGGSGLDPAAACQTCAGSGRTRGERNITASIPPGTGDGATLRLASQGAPGRAGGPPGDLYLRVRVRPDPELRWEGDHIRSDVRVPAWTGALGGEVSVTTLRGTARVRVPAGTSSGATLRLRGKGARGGDHLVRVLLTVPAHPTDEQREHYRRLAELDGAGDD